MEQTSVHKSNFPKNHIIVQKVKELRNKGKSYADISTILCMSKTLAYEISKETKFPKRDSTIQGILNAIVRLK